ncbi:FABP family protein [Candidatus Poriferisocius sp.]|uniref:FABP family protein n=1 Tax=Candidatus Poriferisocius sp. TaxID=3101276 RepID=UPI003B02D321
MVELHPLCAPLEFLLGTWKGTGVGEYPTIRDFSYTEEVAFTHTGKPFVAYAQKTRDAGTGLPLHAESGYLRPHKGGHLELLLVQPSGIAELLEGTVADRHIQLVSTAVVGTATAKPVAATERCFRVDGEVLHASVAMAAMGLGLQHHVASELRRVP